jgi:ABC-type sugar transport system ATPase subunit
MTATALKDPTAMQTVAPAVQLEGVTKRFGSVLALDGINLEVQPGEFVCLVGASTADNIATVLLRVKG